MQKATTSIKRVTVCCAVALASVLVAACGLLPSDSKIDEGIVNAPKLKIRSSTALAALDLAEVKRGDRLEILEQAQVKTPTRTNEWYQVRTKTKEATGSLFRLGLNNPPTAVGGIREAVARTSGVG